MNVFDGNYSLSMGPRPLLVKTVIATLDVMSQVLILSADSQDPYSDVIVPPELLVPPADRQLLAQICETRHHLERAASELTASPDRPTFTCPRDRKLSGLLVATLIATAEEAFGEGRAQKSPIDMREYFDLYRTCAHTLADMHLKAVRAVPVVEIAVLSL